MRLVAVVIACLVAGTGCRQTMSSSSSWDDPVNADQAEAAIADLASTSEVDRSRAAQTLLRLGHPRALEACVATIDDSPDPLHLDMTPSVRCLRQIGKPALVPLIDLLDTGHDMTRRRAEQAVIWITKLYFGFDGSEWTDAKGLDRWSAWWNEMGYDATTSDALRRAALERIRAWLATKN